VENSDPDANMCGNLGKTTINMGGDEDQDEDIVGKALNIF
jgi:hypothetical protein